MDAVGSSGRPGGGSVRRDAQHPVACAGTGSGLDSIVRWRAPYREAVALRRRDFVLVLRRRDGERRRLGTFAPFCRASFRPIAIACFRLRTRPPVPSRPRLSVPFFRRRIAL
jgi:hypothetical protein